MAGGRMSWYSPDKIARRNDAAMEQRHALKQAELSRKYGPSYQQTPYRSGYGGGYGGGSGGASSDFQNQMGDMMRMFQRQQGLQEQRIGDIQTDYPTGDLRGMLAGQVSGKDAGMQGVMERMQRSGIRPGSSRWEAGLRDVERSKRSSVMDALTKSKLAGAEFAQRGQIARASAGGQLTGQTGQFGSGNIGSLAGLEGTLANVGLGRERLGEEGRWAAINRADAQAAMQAIPENPWGGIQQSQLPSMRSAQQASRFGLIPGLGGSAPTQGYTSPYGKGKKKKDYSTVLKG
jgi:hypothetical protein